MRAAKLIKQLQKIMKKSGQDPFVLFEVEDKWLTTSKATLLNGLAVIGKKDRPAIILESKFK